MFLLPARILFSWVIISYVSSSNVSPLTTTLFLVSFESSTICSFLSLVLTMFYSVWFSSTSPILSFTISLSASIILRIISSSKSESHQFFLIALAWSHNRSLVISKTPCSFHSCIIRCLYSLIDLLSSSKGWLLKKHCITILFTLLNHFVLTVVGRRLCPCCRTREQPTGRSTFPCRSSRIHAVIFRILIWNFTYKSYREF